MLEDDLISGRGHVYGEDGCSLGEAYILIDPTMPANTLDGSGAVWGSVLFDDDRPPFRMRPDRVGQRLTIQTNDGRTIRFTIIDERGIVWATVS